MYYEINIAKNGTHFFATAERSLTSEHEMKKALEIFADKFLKEEGYSISVSYTSRTGKELNTENILAEIKKDAQIKEDKRSSNFNNLDQCE